MHVDAPHPVAVIEEDRRRLAKVQQQAAEPAVQLVDERGAALLVQVDQMAGVVRSETVTAGLEFTQLHRVGVDLARKEQADVARLVPHGKAVGERAPMLCPADVRAKRDVLVRAGRVAQFLRQRCDHRVQLSRCRCVRRNDSCDTGHTGVSVPKVVVRVRPRGASLIERFW